MRSLYFIFIHSLAKLSHKYYYNTCGISILLRENVTMDNLITDRIEMRECLKNGKCGLEAASPELRDDEDLALFAVVNNHKEFLNISSRLQHSGDFLSLCVKEDYSIIHTLTTYKIVSFGEDAFMYKYLIAKLAMGNEKVLDLCKPSFRKQVLEEIAQIKLDALSEDERKKAVCVIMLQDSIKDKKYKDFELNALVEELREMNDYDEILERLASTYSFSDNNKVKKKIEEYLGILNFDVKNIEKYLYN